MYPKRNLKKKKTKKTSIESLNAHINQDKEYWEELSSETERFEKKEDGKEEPRERERKYGRLVNKERCVLAWIDGKV